MIENKPQRIKHDYTNEVEVKSLAIREKNKFYNSGTPELNSEINALLTEYMQTKDIHLRDLIIELSRKTQVDAKSHERFGEIVLLMIRKILTKPNYSGYSWSDEFYSNACYRVFKYIHNFDCDKKSDRTGNSVSAFSYITQIIMMSIIEVINKNNKVQKELEKLSSMHDADLGLFPSSQNESTLNTFEDIEETEIIIDYEFKKLVNEIEKYANEYKNLKIYYPKDYLIGFDEYSEIEKILKAHKGNISISKLKI